MPFGPLRSTRLLGARSYHSRLIALWIYSIAWTASVVLLALYWAGVSTPMRIALTPLLVLGVPTIGDLFQTHADYKERWERANGRDLN